MWIKIEVPDDFEPNSEVTLSSDNVTMTGKVWEPKYTEVLNHGFVGLNDFMGDDNAIVQAARVSYGKGTKKTNSDRGLIRYLKRHAHTTPFEMCDFKFHVKAPIFVFRQWHRHRTSSINEYSARYSEMKDEMYFPELNDILPQSSDNKQGRSGVMNENNGLAVLTALEETYETAFSTYEYLISSSDGTTPVRPPDAINNRKLFVEEAALKAIRKLQHERKELWSDEMIDAKIREYYEANELSVTDSTYPGLARELARICLPVACYSEMYWKVNLHNLMHFIKLRSDSHAQKEIRVYSDAMLELIKPLVPWAIEAFEDYDMNAVTVSRMEMEALKELIGEIPEDFAVNLARKGLSAREIKEFMSKLGS